MALAATAPLNFAVVGCGLIGKRRAAALAASAETRLCYACDLDREKAADAAALAPGCRPVADYRNAIEDKRVDAVVVSTVNGSLAPIALAAVQAGKHALIEKPGALHSSELREIRTVAEAKGLRVRIGYNHRFHPALLKAREIVDSGVLGPLMFMRGTLRPRRAQGLRPRMAGRSQAFRRRRTDRPGGPPDRPAPVWFLGEFATVEGHAATYFWDMKVDDNAFLSLRTAAGQTAWLQVSCTEWKNMFSLETLRPRRQDLDRRARGQLRHRNASPTTGCFPRWGRPRPPAGNFPAATIPGPRKPRPSSTTSASRSHPVAGLARRHPDPRDSRDHLPEKRLPHLMIITRSPLRVSLGGGGTDLPATTRSTEASSSRPRSTSMSTSRSTRPSRRRSSSSTPSWSGSRPSIRSSIPIVREALKMTGVTDPHIELTSMADIPGGTGLGSSGSFTTALLKALHAYKKNLVSPAELAEQACDIEINRLGRADRQAGPVHRGRRRDHRLHVSQATAASSSAPARSPRRRSTISRTTCCSSSPAIPGAPPRSSRTRTTARSRTTRRCSTTSISPRSSATSRSPALRAATWRNSRC